MKIIILFLCLVVSSAWAGIEDEGSSFPPSAQSTKPYLKERFRYETTILLDRATFGRLEINRLNLDELLQRSIHHGFKVAYRVDKTREGRLIHLLMDGSAEDMNRYFESLLNLNIVSLVNVMGAYDWTRPSEAYRKYWSDIYSGIQKEIEVKALTQWAAKQQDLKASELCEHMLRIERYHSRRPQGLQLPQSEPLKLTGSGTYL